MGKKKASKSPNHVADYELAFHLLMKRKMRDGVSIEDRIRNLVFAIVDPSCPLRHYARKTPSVQRVSYLIGEIEEDDRQSSPVRDTMFKLSGRLGILNQTSEQVKLRIAVPEPEEVRAIGDLRSELELFGFLRLHRCEDKRWKRDGSYSKQREQRNTQNCGPCDPKFEPQWKISKKCEATHLFFNISRATITRMISFVPSRIWCTRRSRTSFSIP